MKIASLVGIVLIVIGVIALAYGGISYTNREGHRPGSDRGHEGDPRDHPSPARPWRASVGRRRHPGRDGSAPQRLSARIVRARPFSRSDCSRTLSAGRERGRHFADAATQPGCGTQYRFGPALEPLVLTPLYSYGSWIDPLAIGVLTLVVLLLAIKQHWATFCSSFVLSEEGSR